jgi:hypothetical protein
MSFHGFTDPSIPAKGPKALKQVVQTGPHTFQEFTKLPDKFKVQEEEGASK